MKASYIFYQSFYDALKELPDDLRLSMYDAISTYALTGEAPEMSGVGKAVFLLIKPQLDANAQRYENGCKAGEFGALGGRPKKPQENPKETPRKPQRNPKETPKKPQENPKETPNENENENVNENVNVNDYPPYIPPIREGEGDNYRDLFFEKYPRFAGTRVDDSGIEYKVLLDEFEKSERLRGMYTFKLVKSCYADIVKGAFRDKEKPTVVNDVNFRADRERWYSERRRQAEVIAERNLETVRKRFKRYVELEKELKAVELEIVRREIAFNNSIDGYDAGMLEDANAAKARIEEEMKACISKCSLTQADLIPKWHCEKCQDTGWQADGRTCDCFAREVNG